MEQIIKIYKNRKEFYNGNDLGMHWSNYNPDNKEFCGDYLRGIYQGMRIKYKHPVAAVWERVSNGEWKCVAVHGN